MAVLTILLMSALLGAASFGIGMLPLFFTFSRARIAYLSTVGTGLLLGAALGVIIPEGIETLVSSSGSTEIPTNKIAFALLAGFAFMLLVEQFLSGHSHSHSHAHAHPHAPLPTDAPAQPHPFIDGPGAEGQGAPKPRTSEEEFDVALAELEGATGGGPHDRDLDGVPGLDPAEGAKKSGKARAFPMTLGLVIHSLADGLALGASALPRGGSGGVAEGAVVAVASSQLSIVVFMALIIHKAPTALALSMSLISTSLPRSECKKHIAFFSAATPLGALASFAVLTFFGAGSDGDWTGLALLVSGGTFLYVATVLQPVSHHEGTSGSSHEMSEKVRAGLVILGMFIPFGIGLVIGHDH